VTRCVDDPLKEAQVLAEQIVQRSPDSVAMTKQLYQQTWVAPEEYCLRLETELQRKLLVSWNQLAASGRNFGWKLPYFQRRKEDNDK
jgi:enoyl-CoA hydratase/carnithine racemase